MNFSELLSRYRFKTGENEKDIWVFDSFKIDYDHPLKMRRLGDSHIGYFKFSDLWVKESLCDEVDYQALNDKYKRSEQHQKTVDKIRLREQQELIDKLNLTARDINNIIDHFDGMSIDLIKKSLKLLASNCMRKKN